MMKEYKLTEEGEEYLKVGLPERNLVKLLTSFPDKSTTIDKIVNKVKNFPIALKWTLDKGWVLKKNNQLILVKIPEETEEEKVLRKIAEGKEADEKILKVLMERNLVVRISETYRKTEESLKKAGNVIDELTHDIILTGLWKGKKFKPVKIAAVKKIDLKKITPGKRQPYNQFLWQVKQKLVELGFKEMTGPLIETEFWNFDALFQPQNHPARDWTQTYSLKNPKFGQLPNKKIVDRVKATHENGWKTGGVGWDYKWDPNIAMRLMPRAHGTCLSGRTLASQPKIFGKYFAIARCFRPDVIDFKHGVEFSHLESIVFDESLTFKNLLGILKTFAIEFAGARKVKFLPDYYPFTEPSAQLSALHPELGWIEFGGSGVFREELTKPLGIDVPVLAWGLGIDRFAMFKLGINDIRGLFSQNLEWLRNQK